MMNKRQNRDRHDEEGGSGPPGEIEILQLFKRSGVKDDPLQHPRDAENNRDAKYANKDESFHEKSMRLAEGPAYDLKQVGI